MSEKVLHLGYQSMLEQTLEYNSDKAVYYVQTRCTGQEAMNAWNFKFQSEMLKVVL